MKAKLTIIVETADDNRIGTANLLTISQETVEEILSRELDGEGFVLISVSAPELMDALDSAEAITA